MGLNCSLRAGGILICLINGLLLEQKDIEKLLISMFTERKEMNDFFRLKYTIKTLNIMNNYKAQYNMIRLIVHSYGIYFQLQYFLIHEHKHPRLLYLFAYIFFCLIINQGNNK